MNGAINYQVHQMSNFISWVAFGVLKQARQPSSLFSEKVSSVLQATRLPMGTILTALEYVNQRFSAKPIINNTMILSEEVTFHVLIVGFILANKIMDDSTFTNKSWEQASGLDLNLLNKLERDWLEEVKFNLSPTNFENNIAILQECYYTWLSRFSSSGASYSNVNPSYLNTPTTTTNMAAVNAHLPPNVPVTAPVATNATVVGGGDSYYSYSSSPVAEVYQNPVDYGYYNYTNSNNYNQNYNYQPYNYQNYYNTYQPPQMFVPNGYHHHHPPPPPLYDPAIVSVSVMR
ncbi:Cyclin-like protein [Candida maltosa Xu316]|uniref:Cyclin-like protein n=1 Tax=Candida maltosa (strain Xu316) TaxID=1245528 RepID=M3K5P9_CANMX|nr:Cyclin-like protein [Candida maltosa Xu316]